MMMGSPRARGSASAHSHAHAKAARCARLSVTVLGLTPHVTRSTETHEAIEYRRWPSAPRPVRPYRTATMPDPAGGAGCPRLRASPSPAVYKASTCPASKKAGGAYCWCRKRLGGEAANQQRSASTTRPPPPGTPRRCRAEAMVAGMVAIRLRPSWRASVAASARRCGRCGRRAVPARSRGVAHEEGEARLTAVRMVNEASRQERRGRRAAVGMRKVRRHAVLVSPCGLTLQRLYSSDAVDPGNASERSERQRRRRAADNCVHSRSHL